MLVRVRFAGALSVEIVLIEEYGFVPFAVVEVCFLLTTLVPITVTLSTAGFVTTVETVSVAVTTPFL